MQRIIGFYIFYFAVVAFINYSVYGHNEEETAKAQSSRQSIVAPFLQEELVFDQQSASLDQKHTGQTPLQGQRFFTQNLWRNGAVPCRGCLSLALPMQQAQQKIAYTLSTVQETLDSRHKAQYPTSLCLACRRGDRPLGSVGTANCEPAEAKALPQQEFAVKEGQREGECCSTGAATTLPFCESHGHPAMAYTRHWFCRRTDYDQATGKHSFLGRFSHWNLSSTSKRPSDCREKAISGHIEGPYRGERSGRERRSLQFPTDWSGFAPHLVADQQSHQAVESIERSKKPSQGTMAQASQRLYHGLGEPDEKLSGATEAIHRTNQQSKSGIVGCSQEPAGTQQIGRAADQHQSRVARDSRLGGWHWRVGSYRGSIDQASAGLFEASSSNDQSKRCTGYHGLRRRASRWCAQIQKAAVLGAVWTSSYAPSTTEWRCGRYLNVTYGDEAECLRNSLHAPHDVGRRDGSIAEAYAMEGSWCAASSVPSLDHPTMCLILCHSIRWEDHFTPPFVSTKSAIDLQHEVASDLLQEGFLPLCKDPFPKWPILGSILKTSRNAVNKHVTFAADDDPLSSAAVLISGVHDRITDQESEIQSHSWNDATPQTPQQQFGHVHVPDFVQEVFAQFEAAGIQVDTLLNEGFVARTWYLHHQVFPRWRVPRFVELDHDWSRWSDEIVSSWRDMIDRRIPFRLAVVRPDPPRHYLNRRADVDIILAQESEPYFHAGLLTVFQNSFGRSRTLALAISLPAITSGRQIVRSAELIDVCELSFCRLFFRWLSLQLDEVQNHEMQDGHGFQLHIDPSRDLHLHENEFPVDVVNLMQGQVLRTKRPLTSNDHEAPAWYHHINTQGGHAELHHQLLLDADQDANHAEDVGDESPRSEDPFIHPPDDDDARQAVIMFHLVDDPIHAMLDWTDWPRMMREIAYHYAVDREEVLECHELNVRPPDIPQGIVPVIVQQVQDVPVGTAHVLILVDIETHGHWMEAHFNTAPLVERRVVAVPALLTRTALLSQAKVFEYCRFEKDRCLIEFNLRKWLKQDPTPKRVLFGDYAKILLPPSLKCEASTGEMLADSRQLTVEDFWSRYYIPSSPESSSSSSGDSNVSPSLLDSDAIREEFGGRNDDSDVDDLSVMQLPSSSSGEDRGNLEGPPASSAENDTCMVNLLLTPHGTRPPLWFRHLLHNFGISNEIEDITEGPVAYIRTWYLDCSAETASEDSRVVRLSGMPPAWFHDIQRRWQDKINQNLPVHVAWVYPTPPRNPYEHTIGHMLLFQRPNQIFVPLLLSFQFTALRDGTGTAAVVVQKNASPDHVVEIVKLDRVCRGRSCTLHRGTHGGVWGHDLNTGEGLKLIIPSPGDRAADEIHWNPKGVALIFPANVIPASPVLSFCIEDYSPFFQALYRRWLQDARRAHASFERTLEITTWYVDGRHMPVNEESRSLILIDDFSQWEDAIRGIWSDLVDVDEAMIFAFVHPVPPPSPLDRIHVLVMQQVPEDARGVVITKYDNALYHGEPVSVATVVPAVLDRDTLILHTSRAFGSIPFGTHMHCSTWHGGQEILQQPFLTQHGFGFNVLIHRPTLVDWNEDDEQTLLQKPFVGPTPKGPPREVAPASHSQDALRIDLSGTAEALVWFDQHFILPCFDIQNQLDGIAHWYPASLEWVHAAEWFASEQKVDQIRIYYDGSFVKKTGVIGYAAAAFVQFQGSWHFAGAISGRDEEAADLASYKAELNAALIGLKFLYDLLKIQHDCFGARPDCAMIFDSLSVGNQTAGLWKSTRAIHACHLARSILRLCESRFQVECQHFFSPGHSGEPGNELVDTLAGCAAQGYPLQDWQHFFTFSQKPDFVLALEWSWMLFQRWDGTHFERTDWVCPAKPSTRPVPSVLPTNQTEPPKTIASKLDFKLRLATCNVLTLRGRPSNKTSDIGVEGPARLEWILKSLDELGVHFFALQETRSRVVRKQIDERYLLVQSAATPAGHLGIMVGISKKHPFALQSSLETHDQEKIQLKFREQDFSIVVAEPRLLVVKIQHPDLRCIVVAAHAPHTGATIHEIEEFWKHVESCIPPPLFDWPRVVLTDANCRLGSQPCENFGDWQAEEMQEKSEPFAHFLARSDVFLPSTFEQFHVGEGGTWQHLSGKWKRNDFVGLPRSWPLHACSSWLPAEVDFSLQREDHRAVCAEAAWSVYSNRADLAHSVPHRQTKPLTKEFRPEKIAVCARSFHHDFTVDVHTSAMDIQSQLLSCRKFARRSPAKPKKETLSSFTWDLICAKKQWRNTLHDQQKLRQITVQAMFFAAWRLSRWNQDAVPHVLAFDDLICQQDFAVATALFHFRNLGRAVTSAIRNDDKKFFASLAEDASDFLAPHQVKDFWKIIRRSLPKFRTRKRGQDPNTLEVLHDQWVPYFSQLEVGTTKDANEIVEQCHARHMNMPIVQRDFHFSDLPSLIELEDAIRLTHPDRATGLDPLPSGLFRTHVVDLAKIYFPLVLKQCLWQCEPLASKGGQMAVIHKKGSTLQAGNYRGIMLLPTIAKRFHALIRKRLMDRLHGQRPQCQIGCFAHMQVPFGSQMLQVFGRIMDARGLSSAIVFVDLTNAFHRLIRELVSGVHLPEEVEAVLQALRAEGLPEHEVAQLLELPSLLQQLNAPPFLVQLLQDLHTDTWLKAPGDERFLVTRRGTRPGSPLADCIFHILMADITKDINRWFAEQVDFQHILHEADLEVECVVWADDLALPLAAKQAAHLPSMIDAALVHVYQVFLRRGFLLNLNKGKTSVVATFKGPGAADLRRQYQLSDSPGMTVQLGPKEAFVHFVPHYKHLGTIFSSSHSLDLEIATRIGLARGAFAQISAPILCNRHLPVKIRLQLFKSLVESKLFFGLGAWAPLTVRQTAKIQSAILLMLKRVLRLTREEHETLTAADVFHRAGHCLPRARIALDRLLYAQKIWEHGPPLLQHYLHKEEEVRSDSWLGGLKSDLAWLHALEPTLAPNLSNRDDLTETFDFWQTGNRNWRLRVKRAWKRFCFQESMMNSLFGLHKTFFRVFQQSGASFRPSPFTSLEQPLKEFACSCGKVFSTQQGLSCHRRLIHHEFALEHDFLAGATCPSCLRFFWTKQRLYLHLAYISRRTGINRCFQQLKLSGFRVSSDEQAFQQKPEEVQGLARVEALQAEGPLLPMIDCRRSQISQLQQELDQIHINLQVNDLPDEASDMSENVRKALTLATKDWFQTFCDEGFDESLIDNLPDRWILLLGDSTGKFDEWFQAEFMQWGQDDLPDVIADFMDGRAECLVDEAFCELVSVFPRFDLLQKRTHLMAKMKCLENEVEELFPHRAIRRGSANVLERATTAAHVPASFEEQETFFCQLRQVAWFDLPIEQKVPIWSQPRTTPIFLIAHLFSGRRRATDVHAQLSRWAEEANIQVLVLSLDTANSETFGNLHITSTTWSHLLQLYREGRIAATLAGAPCETWSAARHQPLEQADEGQPDQHTGPRPLRSANRIFGLAGLSMKELRQLSQGTHFFLQTIITIAWTICTGGLYISEHPAPPGDEQIASVWTTPWTMVLRQHPEVELHIMNQWKWGCETVKPTGLLAVRLPRFASSMYQRQIPDARRPTVVAIGRGANGQFRTSALKEYPPQFCAALAGALVDELRKRYRSGRCREIEPPAPDLVKWVTEAEAFCGQIRADSKWLPDYQGS